MLKIGKLEEAANQKINVTIGTSESTYFENGKKNQTILRPELEIEIEGTVDDNNYLFNFYIDKPFEEYLDMKNYEKVTIDSSFIKEDFAQINDKYQAFPIINIEVLKLAKTLTFIVKMQSTFDEYFATSEFDITIDTIENAIKKD